jgi:hypothetical protein
MALTLAQRRSLAMAVLSKVSELFEFWNEEMDSNPWLDEEMDVEEAAQVVSNWLSVMPTGGKWLASMPDPKVRS